MFGAARLALFAANPVATGAVTGGISYFFGGYRGGYSTTNRKYNLTTGAVGDATNAVPSGTMLAGSWGSGVNGWCTGGFNGGDMVAVRRMAFSSESWTTLTSLGAAQRNHRGTSSSTKGYSWGGYRASVNLSTNSQWTYSTDAYAAGTALGWGTSPTSFGALHGNGTTALHMGSGVDGAGGTSLKHYLIYTFSSDAQSYSSSGAAYGHTLGGTTGNQTDMVVLSGYRSSATPPSFDAPSTGITRYTISSAALVSDGGTVGTAFNHFDGAGDDSVGIFAGCNADADRTAREQAYTYATSTATLLSAYLANNQLYNANNWENPTACHSLQVS
jgi:hypothetical protein